MKQDHLHGRSNLLYVRAGTASLHPTWVCQDPNRNWDCYVSYYAPAASTPVGERHSTGGRNKFEGFLAMLQNDPSILEQYDWFFLVDDDIAFKPRDISRFFEYCRKLQTDLAQPSLKWSCFWTFPHTVHNPITVARRTNFVEVMMPCFSRRFLKCALDTFTFNISTWGLEYAFQARLTSNQSSYIIDAIIAEHIKKIDPVDGAFYRYLTNLGCDPHVELREMELRYPLAREPSIDPSGHVFRWPGLTFINPLLLGVCERFKHRRRLRASFSRLFSNG